MDGAIRVSRQSLVQLREQWDKRPLDWGDWQWQVLNSLHGPAGLADIAEQNSRTETRRAGQPTPSPSKEGSPEGDSVSRFPSREGTGVGSSGRSLLRRLLDLYPFRVTPYYLSLARGCENDPILLQCIPSTHELAAREGVSQDPFGEETHSPVPGLIHRYRNRALILVTGLCAVRCRHCTRKNVLPGAACAPTREAFKAALDYVAGNSSIREVILSGGDPLLLAGELLDWLLAECRRIRHVEVLRIGTRVPVVLPARVDDALCRALARHRPLWLNTQFNHPWEVSPEAVAACEKLVAAGIPVSNQAVLLRGVNDDVDTMRELCNALQSAMVRPYYVFQCDPVSGTGHLRTDPRTGAQMRRRLTRELAGLALPRFVADIPGEPAKRDL